MGSKKRSSTPSTPSKPSSTPQSSRNAVAGMSAGSKPTSAAPVIPPFHRKQPRKIGYLRSWVMWYEGTLAMSMFETWEKILLHSIALIFVALLYTAVSRYLPARLQLIQERVRWYIFGGEVSPAAVKAL